MDWQRRLDNALAWPLADQLNPRMQQNGATLRPAAVLVAIEFAAQPRIILTRRSRHLRHHPGQISFPGGRQDDGDDSLATTALRESAEEIGLPATAVTLAGQLPQHVTVSGFQITPFVGWIPPKQPLQAAIREVELILHLPLVRAMNPQYYRLWRQKYQGRTYGIYALDYQGHHIWGATAAMLAGLARQMAHAEGRDFDQALQWLD